MKKNLISLILLSLGLTSANLAFSSMIIRPQPIPQPIPRPNPQPLPIPIPPVFNKDTCLLEKIPPKNIKMC